MKISIVTPTYNEEKNIPLVIDKIKNIMSKVDYDYEHIIIDNNSTDRTQEVIKSYASEDKNIKAIFNLHNYGQSRSPFYAMLNTSGDAVIWIDSDLQIPFESIPDLISKWETKSSDIILLKRTLTYEGFFLKTTRFLFYKFINIFSSDHPSINTNGNGLYDRKVIEQLKNIHDPNPYLRGLIFELGFRIDYINFERSKRIHGKTSNNFFTLLDLGMTGIVKHTRAARGLIILGFILSLFFFILSLIFLLLKLIFWDFFEFGLAPLMIGLFLIGSLQLFFLGIIGEYCTIILNYSKNLPIVIERERINF